MPSSVIGALRVNLGLDSGQFNRGASDAEKRAYKLGENIGKAMRSPIASIGSLKGAIGGLAGALALNELVGAGKRAFDFADAIVDLSDRTGASTKAIQEFRYAAQLSGSSVEVADAATEKFARTLGLAQQGSAAQVKMFRELGVTSTDFDTALRQTLDGIAKLPTVQQRAAVGFQIFGKSSATLTALLGQGSAGFDELAQKARQYGIVIENDVLRNAGAVNDKLDTLKQILDAQFAGAIVQNADAIVRLAESFIQATAAAAKFFGQLQNGGNIDILNNPNLSRISSRILGNDPAATRKAAFDGLLSNKVGRQQLFERNRAQRAALKVGNTSTLGLDGGGIPDNPASRAAERKRLVAERTQIVAAQRAGRESAAGARAPIAAGTLPTSAKSDGKAGGGKAASDAKRMAAEQQRAAEKEAADERRFQQDLARSRDDQLSAQLDLTVNQTERANIQQTILDNDTAARLEDIATSKDLTAEQKRQLTIIETETGALRARLLHRQDQEEIARQELDALKAANSNQQDILTAQANLARTAKERGAIERQILDLQFDYLKKEQQKALDDAQRRGDARGAASAQDNLATIGKVQGYAIAKSARDNQGPLASYLDGVPRSAAQVNEAIEGIQANGLSSLIDGLSKVEGGFKGLAATVQNVADDIISSLIKIGLQKGIAALFGNLIGGATGSSAFSSSDFLNQSTLPTFAGARAKGGPVSPCAAGGDIIMGSIW